MLLHSGAFFTEVICIDTSSSCASFHESYESWEIRHKTWMVMNSKGLPADGTAATRLQDSSPCRSMECCPSLVSPPPSTTNYNLVRYRCSNHSSSDSIEGNFYIDNRFITAHIPNDLLQSSQPSWSHKLLVQIMHRLWLNLGQTWIGTSNVCESVSPLRHEMNHFIYSQILYKPFANAQDSI